MKRQHVLEYKKLELLDQDWFPDSWLAKFAAAVIHVGQAFLKAFAPEDDIKIWQKYTRKGQVMFYVRDRQTGHLQRFTSENELRIWLEERHHFYE